MIKKTVILTTLFLLFAGISVGADCIIGLNWTPDPVQSAVTGQEVWYNPDGVVDNGNEVLKAGALASDTNQAEFTEVGVTCSASHTVYVVTKYIGGIEKKSNEIIPQSVVGAVLDLAIQDQQ